MNLVKRHSIPAFLLYLALRFLFHEISIHLLCPTSNEIIDGYTCSRNVFGFVFSSILIPLSFSHTFRMTTFPFFLMSDILFEVSPISFLIFLHHAVCIVGHYMVWSTERNGKMLSLEYSKILVAFEFGSGLTNLYDWFGRYDIQLSWIVLVGMTISNMSAMYFVLRLLVGITKKKKKKSGMYEFICICLLSLCTVVFAFIRETETMSLVGIVVI
jgi:hypothetical protein